MKSTTYIAVITTHKAEKYLSEGRKLGSTSLLTCSPAHFLSTCTPPTTPPPPIRATMMERPYENSKMKCNLFVQAVCKLFMEP